MRKIVGIILINIFILSCGTYSFTGASIPSGAKNVVVNYFTNKATNSPSSLKQTITEELKDLPYGLVWEEFCARHSVPAGQPLIKDLEGYQNSVSDR